MVGCLHSTFSNVGCQSFQLYVGGNLSTTWAAYLAWEDINDRAAETIRSAARRFSRSLLQSTKCDTSINLYSNIDASSEPPKLINLCFEACNLEEKRAIVALAPHIGEEWIRTQHAHRTIQKFCKAWIVWSRAQNKGKNSNSIIMTKKDSPNEREGNHKRVCWSLKKVKLKTLVDLFRKFDDKEFEYLNMNPSSWNGLYILWLINPVVLGSLLGVFVTFDLTLPLVKKLMRRILLVLNHLVEKMLNILYKRSKKKSLEE
mmetsp:Transcript_5253/g.6117  ORF Transcript_5253/g.6117 Transcript_5253/m.6117 type:complete len:259 (-) Transcript_5253:1217-1993(-)